MFRSFSLSRSIEQHLTQVRKVTYNFETFCLQFNYNCKFVKNLINNVMFLSPGLVARPFFRYLLTGAIYMIFRTRICVWLVLSFELFCGVNQWKRSLTQTVFISVSKQWTWNYKLSNYWTGIAIIKLIMCI